MNYKKTMILRWVVALSFLTGTLAMAAEQGDQPKKGKPNIIFIFTDDQRYNTIHALGGSQVITPHLDGLVNNGTTFTHAYNMGAWGGAVCVTSRAMLITGMSVWDVQEEEKDYSSLLGKKGFWPQQMKLAGYDTYMTGKWHIKQNPKDIFDRVEHVRPGMPNQTPQGYNRPLSPADTTWQPWDQQYEGFWKGGTHWTQVVADDAVGYIDQASKKDEPFFMYLAFNSPHDPRQAPKRWVDRYPVQDIELPTSYLDEYPFKEEMGAGKGLRDEKLAPFPRTPYSVKKNIQEYYASISYTDEQIGRILEALKKSGKMDNTYIFFTADHGLAVGHHGLMGKQSMFDHSMRPPLIVAGPDIPKGEKRSQDVYLQDIMASAYELAGIKKPEHVYFNSLLPMVKDKNKPSSYKSIYGCYTMEQRMVRTPKYKMIVYPKANKILLFDMVKDPEELHDIAGDPANKAILKSMKAKLIQQQKEMNDKLDLTAYLSKI
ncbi:arylsulfatase A-like enzyme [Dyadobacter jejuensis]|uniref:Arylsulfatase A-like enzyme n=1 Tax=Dyadobacter jejuensis TaxID=1082580 RepID=A0A316AKK2_9BACT|nr:sulfatase-like hydrolase/transferase [Dyadobacter jejuensis]PWJ57898.1 arylsulfatase A-like enzyme [Dyadobacter jejuensis]